MWKFERPGGKGITESLISGFLLLAILFLWDKFRPDTWPSTSKMLTYIAAFVFGALLVHVLRSQSYGPTRTAAGGLPTSPEAALLQNMDRKLGSLLKEFSGDGMPTPPPFHFDPRSVIADRPMVQLGGLWNGEPMFSVLLNMRNVSGWPLEITGLEGRISIADQVFRLPYDVGLPPPLRTPDDYSTLRIDQPVSTETKQYLLPPGVLDQEHGAFRIDLTGLRLKGKVTSPEGAMELKNCYLVVPPLFVRGSLRTPEQANNLQPWEALFADQTAYSSLGELKI